MTRRSDNRGVAADGLSARSRNILAVLVKHYIDTGEPVSSLWLAEHGDIGLSSASVRNIMAELEQRGYVHQPHTSAGRVPTDHGYRCFVDLLLERRRGTQPTREVEARLRQAGTLGDVLSNVSHELSVGVAASGLCPDAASRVGNVPAHRVRPPRRHPHPRGREHRGQQGRAQDGRSRRVDRPQRARAGRPASESGVRRAAPLGSPGRRHRATPAGTDAVRPASLLRASAGQLDPRGTWSLRTGFSWRAQAS